MFYEACAGFGESGEHSVEKALVDLGLFSLQDKDKVSLTKTPKLDRSDGGKEVKERATKRKLPFTVGTNGDQKDSDTGTAVPHPTLKPWLLAAHRVQSAANPQGSAVPNSLCFLIEGRGTWTRGWRTALLHMCTPVLSDVCRWRKPWVCEETPPSFSSCLFSLFLIIPVQELWLGQAMEQGLLVRTWKTRE